MASGQACPVASGHVPASHVGLGLPVHCPAAHVPVPHALHPLPWLPQAVGVVPATHCPAEQHPLHDVPSHAHVPDTQ
jgi:hypothetical protein